MNKFSQISFTAMDVLLSIEDPTYGLIMYVSEGVMARNFPEIQEMVEFKTVGQSKHLWRHVLQVIESTPKDNRVVRWAALFHDVGKPATVREDKVITFHGHEIIGVKIWNRVAGRMGLEGEFKKDVALLIRHHHEFVHLADTPVLTDKAIRRFVRKLGSQLENLYLLVDADMTSTNDSRIKESQKRCGALKKRIKQVIEDDSKVAPKLPKGTGHRLYDSLGLKGVLLGEVMDKLTQKLVDGEIALVTDDLGYYVREAIKLFDGVVKCKNLKK